MMFFGLATVGITGTRMLLHPFGLAIDHHFEQVLDIFAGR